MLNGCTVVSSLNIYMFNYFLKKNKILSGQTVGLLPQLLYLEWALLVAQMAKNPPVNVGDGGSIPGLGRSVGEENGNTLQCSCLENHMDRGAWWTIVHGVTKSRT